MIKIETGMYARTDEGIQKITNYKYFERYANGHCLYFDGDTYHGHLYEEEVLPKHSYNIIDLIEVGDYVNGDKVEDIFEKTTYADKSIKLKGSRDYWYDIHIKSIVTKEQFESMEYKVGGNSE